MGENKHILVLCGNQVKPIDVRNEDGSIDLDVVEFWARKGSIIVSDDDFRIMIEAFLQAYDAN